MSTRLITAAHELVAEDGEQRAGNPRTRYPLDIVRGIFEHHRRQRDYRRLLEMPDYLLEDIGLTRAQVIAAMQRPLV
jgi:uncharacterized protein YjiS (DUF1127 family)